MGTATSLTAARMLEIEAASVVDGSVVGDNLILERHDGTTINAGNVRGPEGDVGPAGLVVQELGGGVDLDTITTTGVYSQSGNADAISGFNYPTPQAGFLEVYTNPANNLTWQRYTPYATAVGHPRTPYSRAVYLGVWAPWKVLGARHLTAVSTATTALVTATVTIISGWAYSSGDSTLDADDLFTMDGSSFTATEYGLYAIAFSLTFASNTTGRRVAMIYENGSEKRRVDVGSGGSSVVQVCATLPLVIGDVLTFRGYQSSGGNLALGSAPGHDVDITKLP